MTEKTKAEPLRQKCIVENKEYRKYFSLEDGIVVDEKYFKIENGLEIPAEEPKDGKYVVRVPKDLDGAEKIQIIDKETGKVTCELTKGSIPRNKDRELYFQLYNETKNIGEIHKIVDGFDVETRFFNVENGQEVFVPRPKNDERKYIARSHDITEKEQLLLFDEKTNQLIKEIPRKHVLIIDDTEIVFGHNDIGLVHDILVKVRGLSEEDKKKLKETLSKPNSIRTLHGKNKSKAEYNEVKEAVEDIISTPKEAQEDLYKSIDRSQEFGISRFVADRVYHLPKLLQEPTIARQEGTNIYIVRAETGDSRGNTIKLEHRFPSKSEDAANETAKIVIQRLQTVQHKIWLAAWQLANKLGRLTYTCHLTNLMQICHPGREGYFSTKEKIQFYEDLRSLENTKLVFSKKIKTKRGKQPIIEDYEIRLLEIEKKEVHKKNTLHKSH